MTTLNAERQIENLIYSYAERIDSGDLAGVGELFGDAKIISGEGEARFEFVGSDEVEALYRNTVRIYECGTPRTKHMTTNVSIFLDESGDRAAARSYYAVLQRTDDLPLQTIISGRYEDQFSTASGSWAFESRTMFIDLVGDVSQHLLFDLNA